MIFAFAFLVPGAAVALATLMVKAEPSAARGEERTNEKKQAAKAI
ncbi:MAG: hypothetical protein OEO84_10400 [Betaproteobacteria bacterium]|nr:hypothetical protein [Betaproteobacteria bacterium]